MTGGPSYSLSVLVCCQHLLRRAGVLCTMSRCCAVLHSSCQPCTCMLLMHEGRKVHMQADGQLLVLELCSSDLERVLAASQRPIPASVAQAIFCQLVQAMAACHSSGAA